MSRVRASMRWAVATSLISVVAGCSGAIDATAADSADLRCRRWHICGADAGSAPRPPDLAGPIDLSTTANDLAMVASHSVGLNWMASTTPGVTYNVYRSTQQGGPYASALSGVTATSATDSSVASATTYYYVVRAQNSGGESANSNETQAVIP